MSEVFERVVALLLKREELSKKLSVEEEAKRKRFEALCTEVQKELSLLVDKETPIGKLYVNFWDSENFAELVIAVKTPKKDTSLKKFVSLAELVEGHIIIATFSQEVCSVEDENGLRELTPCVVVKYKNKLEEPVTFYYSSVIALDSLKDRLASTIASYC